MAEISVIIPTYNHAAYVGQAIRSVLDQTYTDFELVVVDDGSTDATPQVLAGFTDPRLRAIRQENRGLPAARNAGLRESSAPLVTFLDADDYLLPEMLVTLCGYLDRYPQVGVVTGAMRVVDSDGRVLSEQTVDPASLSLPALAFGNPLADTVVLRRDWLRQEGVFDETLHACEDWDLWLRLAASGCRFAQIDDVLVVLLRHAGQMTGETERMRTAMLAVLDKFFHRPDLPAELRVLEGPARAAALVKAAGRAYHAGQYELAGHDLIEAVLLDPSLAADHYHRLVGLLQGWAEHPHPQSPGPEAYLRRVYDHLPPELAPLRTPLRHALAAILLRPLFPAPPTVRREQRANLVRAIGYDPAWLRNRGVWRMLAEAWSPIPLRRPA